ncbi:o-succinylbenzoate synthase [Micropruina sonneratiae]|uniref:o-succinylbenzoate synthase n=1 Tax=Micropruina sonneratiae TaxID=2986940 RepID=UPI002225DD74|nr:o-succinylbenzoate synthase [Micropruina sp. KQZ13P-5]MCW3159615.1 o-succinylbenzoate synthase [Micropruina sp. KQZ13P-5]
MPATLDLHRLAMPLVRPFRTSKGEETVRDVLVARFCDSDGIVGWGESAADAEPIYFPEYIDGVRLTIERVLLPLLSPLAAAGPLTVGRVRAAMSGVPGNQLARGLIETAVLDAELRRHELPFVDWLGSASRPIRVGVSVGIPGDLDTLLSWVAGYLEDGYRRVKLKIAPGWDLAPVRAVREAFGDDLPLQVDANQAYTAADIPLLTRLDAYGLLLIEQPFARHDLVAHAALAARRGTPVCLDESVLSLDDAMTAIRLGAADVVNIKPSRVGGYLTSRQIHDVCLANGVPVFCGGTLETAVGRAANLALATLPGFTLPGDISATSRYYAADIGRAFELDADGCLAPPTGPGFGVEVDAAAIEEFGIESVRHEVG